MPTGKEIGLVLSRLRERYSGLTMLAGFSRESPFYVLISTVLSARNRDEQTAKVVKRLFARYRTPEEIAAAPVRALERLVKQSGFYHVKARRIKELSQALLDRHDGQVPNSMEELVSLPGVGRKTAGCVLVYAFAEPAIPVDTHVHRISNRLGWVRTRTPEQTEQALLELVPKKHWLLVNEAFVLHGQQVCRPQRPLCQSCPVKDRCRFGADYLGSQPLQKSCTSPLQMPHER